MKYLRYFLLICLILTALFAVSCEAECSHPNMEENRIAPTCTKSGKTEYVCPDCDYSYTENISDPTGHSYEKTVIAPTCEEGGYTLYSCDCGSSYKTDILSALGHDYVPVEVAPTCSTQGYKNYSCSVCNDSFIADYVAPLGHSISQTVTEPTCTSVGYTTYSCQNCSFSYQSDFKAPKPHSMSTQTVAPTCTEQGYTLRSCQDCNYSYKSDFTKPTGHTYNEEIISTVSCTESGEIKYSCSCGDTYTVTVKPNGHSFTGVVTMPSLSDMGYTEYTCSVCSFSYTGDLRFYNDILPNGAYANNSTVIANGIDISKYNYTVDSDGNYISLDWDAIKAAGIDYAIIKAGSSLREGFTLGGTDPTFEQSYRDAKAAGINVGVYFYTYARTVDDIIFDAQYLISILDGKQFEYPIYLDLEDEFIADIDPAMLTQMCVEFFTVLQRAGYYTGLYVNNEWLYNKIQHDKALSMFEIWYARYPADSSLDWNVSEYGSHLGMWQYTDEGRIDGIADIPFDMNKSYKDYPTLIKEGGFNGYGSDVKFIDSGKEFVWVIAEGGIKVRASSDYFTSVTDQSDADVIGYASRAARLELLEKNENYLTVRFNGQIAYITSNEAYISYKAPYIIQTDSFE